MANPVIDLLQAKRIPYQLLPHPGIYDADLEASALGTPKDEVLKTIVLDVGKGHVVAVTSASSRLDMALVRAAVADKHAHLATESEIERDFPAFELGALPPLPSLSMVPVFVDPEVMLHEVVVFADTPQESVRVRTEDLFGGEYVTVTPLVQHLVMR